MATIAQAVRLALHEAEERLGLAHVFGQDVGPPLGGVFTVTQGLRTAWSTPLDERGIVGTAAGLAMMGVRSVCDIQFGDYVLNTIDLLRLVGNTCWSTRGHFPMPMVLMTPVGGGIHGGIYHSHSIESLLTRLPGWKIVMPSNAHDAYGLMLSAVEDGNPVAFLIPKALVYKGTRTLPGEPPDLARRITAPHKDRERWRPDWPHIRPFRVPIGPLSVVARGDDLTLATWGRMVEVAQEALAAMGEGARGRVEVLDLRTLAPWDVDGVVESARRTGRLLVVNEDSEVTNFGEHVIRVVDERCALRARALVAARHVPGIGLAQALEDATLPTADDVRAAVSRMLP